MTNTGYDAAQARREEDDLDRWRFAAEIVEVILATHKDWSVRIGIFGKWGDGKTTVLRFAEQMLKDKNNVVFSFSPWAVQNWNDLWEEFGDSLMGALEAAKIPFDGSWKTAVKDSGKWLESRGLGQVGEIAAALVGREKLYNGAFGIISRWLKYNGAQIQAIQKKLQNRRLVVLIDDLDRCSPELLPRLLLSLRELLDLPGFTFLLAFDNEIVGRALTEKNPAWVEGSNFLDKILDFRFHLPALTPRQKERFIFRAINNYCPFVPKESAKEIQDLFPNNPRKLKALIRSLVALQPQLARHDPDEWNWVDMWLAQMVRLESNPFFEHLLENHTLDKEAGTLYKLVFKKEGEERNQSLKRLIEESGVDNPLVTQRLIQLIEAIRSRASSRFQYICEIAMRPHAVTWKEFRSMYAAWASDRRAQVLSRLITEHSRARGVSVDDVEDELFEAILKEREASLSAAADSQLIQEQEEKVNRANALLQMVEQYLLDLGKLGASQFHRLYGQISYWFAFRKNPGDKRLRGEEEKLLLKLLSKASGSLSVELLEIVSPQNSLVELGEGDAERQALRDKCFATVGPNAAKEAIAFVTRPGGIQSLTEPGRFSGVKYCLFGTGSPVWNSTLRDELLELVRRGREDFAIYCNVRDYFEILVQGLEFGIDSIRGTDLKALLTDEAAFVGSLWETVTSRQIQYRMQISYIHARQLLIRNGVAEAVLPLTDELKSRLKEEESRANRPIPSTSADIAPAIPGEGLPGSTKHE